MPMETFIRENGKMERLMVMEFLLIQKAQCILDNGKMTSSMVRELNHGAIIKSSFLVNFLKEKRQEKVVLNLLVDFTREILSTDNFTDSENTIFQIQANFMKENSNITIWKEKV